MKKLKIAVLFGGCSTEYEVSLQSAYSVLTHMDRGKYDAVPLGITPSGEWFHFTGDPIKIKENTWRNTSDCVKAILSPCRETGGVLEWDAGSFRVIRVDAAMPVLHGKNGEDGTVQGLLELAGIPVVGCKTLSSALCMDKHRAHRIVSLAGVRAARAFTLKKGSEVETALTLAKGIGYPLFVKPVHSGSSYGITKVTRETDLPAALESAFAYDEEAIVEESIPGFEVGCSVLGNDGDLIVGAVDEIELGAGLPEDGFFTYHEKYNLATARIHVPARIPERKAAQIRETAKTIYRALGCAGFARVDMFLTPTGEIVFNEVNTIPGFCGNSRYMAMLKAKGLTFAQVIDKVIELAVRT